MKSLLLGCLILIAAAMPARAQLSAAGVVARFRERAQAAEVRHEECVNKPVYVVAMTAGGAVAGWFAFLTVGLGLFASDHGEVYQRSRRRFMLGGAAIGAGVALYQSVTMDCIPLRGPAPRRR
jgi:hypothetical protein